MQISLLQLNINADNFWDQLTRFLSSHDFDILQLQEVIGPDTFTGNINCKRDCFADLQTILGPTYNGELAIAQRFSSSPHSYFGNATFYKNTFTLINKQVLQLHTYPGLFPSESEKFQDEGRNLLHLKLSIAGQTISVLNMHGAWAKGPIEQPHQTKQSEIVINYLKTISKPFIFSGDLNLTPDQPFIQKVNKFTRNLTTENTVSNTLNPRTHYVKKLFPPGFAVDYIFTTPDLKVTDFQLIQADISDHFGLSIRVEI